MMPNSSSQINISPMASSSIKATIEPPPSSSSARRNKGIDMKANIRMEIFKALECISIKMVMSTWDSGRRIKEKAEESISMQMVIGSKENIKKVKETVWDWCSIELNRSPISIYTKMGESLKEYPLANDHLLIYRLKKKKWFMVLRERKWSKEYERSKLL